MTCWIQRKTKNVKIYNLIMDWVCWTYILPEGATEVGQGHRCRGKDCYSTSRNSLAAFSVEIAKLCRLKRDKMVLKYCRKLVWRQTLPSRNIETNYVNLLRCWEGSVYYWNIDLKMNYK